mmetsp:Transcript_14670/g.34012  ORF Transcript_14670/g.34012 Transcript_14670/m.34012 type:complete len:113 (+) Transcript_14670:191-529(+)
MFTSLCSLGVDEELSDALAWPRQISIYIQLYNRCPPATCRDSFMVRIDSCQRGRSVPADDAAAESAWKCSSERRVDGDSPVIMITSPPGLEPSKELSAPQPAAGSQVASLKF